MEIWRLGLLIATFMMIAGVACCYLAAINFRSLPGFVRQRPLIFLHAVFWVLLAAIWTIGPTQPRITRVLTGCAFAMPYLMWRLSYLLQTAQRGRMAGTSALDHVLYIWPVWGGTNTPYGKGFDYLKSCEASDEESLARSQLAGIKLFVLAFMCSIGVELVDGLVFGADTNFRRQLGGVSLGLPTVRCPVASATRRARLVDRLGRHLLRSDPAGPRTAPFSVT